MHLRLSGGGGASRYAVSAFEDEEVVEASLLDGDLRRRQVVLHFWLIEWAI